MDPQLEHYKKLLGLWPEARQSQTTGIILRLLCEDDLPGRHQPGSFSHPPTGVASLFAMDSRMPGTSITSSSAIFRYLKLPANAAPAGRSAFDIRLLVRDLPLGGIQSGFQHGR